MKIHQAQAKNFCRVLDIRVPKRVEGKVPQPSDFKNLIIVLFEGPGFDISAHWIGNDHTSILVLLTRCSAIHFLEGTPGHQILDELGE